MSERVKKRVTFYIEGYDPRGARHYYKLYKSEAGKEAEKEGNSIEISERSRTGEHIQSCRIVHRSSGDGENVLETATEYHFLEWDDIIRRHWGSSIISVYRDLLFFMWTYMPNGLILKLGRLAPYQMIAAFYPVIYLLGAPLMAGAVGYYLYDAMASMHLLLGVLSGAAAFWGIMRLSILIGNRIAVFWLLRIYAFCAQYGYGDVPELDARIERFAERIAQTLSRMEEEEIDEVLVVSHSVGTIVAIPILAKALERSGIGDEALKRLSVLSLGECIALVSFMPKATAYRESMRYLITAPNFCWLDYTSAIDGGCSVQLDFYKHSGVLVERPDTPRYLSPRFHTLYTPQSYAVLSRNKYLAHFLYLMATEKDGGYNYIKMTSGHRRLCDYI